VSELPWHPAWVHLPLGLSPVVLMASIGSSLATWRGWATHRAWWGAVALQGVLVVGMAGARWTGESEAESLWTVVGEAPLQTHHAWANGFSVLAIVTWVLMVGAAVAREPRASMGLGVLASLASAVLVWLGLQTGHSGAEIVWTYGAAHHHYEQHHQTSKALEPR